MIWRRARWVTRSKLRHDIEQVHYLRSRGELPEAMEGAAEGFGDRHSIRERQAQPAVLLRNADAKPAKVGHRSPTGPIKFGSCIN